jgi:hypothetical protein
MGRLNVPDARALPRDKADLKLDGKLDDKFWNVRSYQLSELETGRSPDDGTSFLVAWGSDNALYLGIKCGDLSTTNLNITATRNGDTNIWQGDAIVILIETPVHSYYQIAVNPAGAIVDVDMKDGTHSNWSSGATAAAFIGDGFWSLEVRLPAAGENAQEITPLHGISGAGPNPTFPWSINVCRQRIRGSNVERSAWSPTGSSRFNDVTKLGTVWCK